MLPKQVGGSLSGNHHRGTWSCQERTKHIYVLELIAVKLAILTFTRGKSETAIPLTNRHYGSSVLLGKNGGNSQSRIATSSQGNMGLLLTNRIAVTGE